MDKGFFQDLISTSLRIIIIWDALYLIYYYHYNVRYKLYSIIIIIIIIIIISNLM